MDFRSGSDRERGGGALGEYIKKIKDRSKRRKKGKEKKGNSTPQPTPSRRVAAT